MDPHSLPCLFFSLNFVFFKIKTKFEFFRILKIKNLMIKLF